MNRITNRIYYGSMFCFIWFLAGVVSLHDMGIDACASVNIIFLFVSYIAIAMDDCFIEFKNWLNTQIYW